MSPGLSIAYLLHRFPHHTETFIVREMSSIRDMGADLRILSLLSPGSASASTQGEDLIPLSRYDAWLSIEVVAANMAMVASRPGRYIRSLGRLIGRTWREPRVLGLMLALFPKTVAYARLLERDGVEHMHAHFVWIEGLAAGVIRDLTGIPFTIQPHAFGLFGRNQRDVRAELADAAGIITISEYNRRHIEMLDPALADRIEVVHCGVDPDRFPSRPEGDSAGPVRIVSVGRAVEKKGHHHLVDACGMLAASGVDFRCQIVAGLDAESEPIRRRIDDLGLDGRVEVLDMMGEDGIIDLLHGGDIFALACVIAQSGDRDGIPVAIMEAMACELPVVSTRVSGVPELVEHEGSGLLVPPADPAALADALVRLIDRPEDRVRMGRRGREIVIEKFDARSEAARSLAIFTATARGTS